MYGPKTQSIVPKRYLNSGRENMNTKKEAATSLKKGKGLRISARVTAFGSSLKDDFDTIEVTIGKNPQQIIKMDIPRGIGVDLVSRDFDLILVEKNSRQHGV